MSKEFQSFFAFPFDYADTMEVSPIALTNIKRKADEMDSNQPEELQTVKIQKTESVESKYQKGNITRTKCLAFRWSEWSS